mmetsp:Transcript_2289/g.5643  ORF Transcript_2289/g.5643 Transcript_2289/m.5643 type:complete len:720 (+) Transcript_2289:179-2338(+)
MCQAFGAILPKFRFPRLLLCIAFLAPSQRAVASGAMPTYHPGIGAPAVAVAGLASAGGEAQHTVGRGAGGVSPRISPNGATHLGFGELPPAVVVHGRRGRNCDLNGIYQRDYTGRCQAGPCYKRTGAAGQKTVFLYRDEEWRIGPSPEEGSVWALAQSSATSPLSIEAPWEVWDGERVMPDFQLKVSDTSVIPPVLFLSFRGEDVPATMRFMQGMLMQQPGLWDGRPYYRHQAWADLFLLCSVTEGRWRLGPLPIAGNAAGATGRDGTDAGSLSDNRGVALFAVSAAAVPQEIVEPWQIDTNDSGHFTLGDGAVRLATTTASARLPGANVRHPRHLVVEGVDGNELANGVYRRAPEEMNGRPVYHKTDALRAASLWFTRGGDWCLGATAPEGPAWVCAASTALSPLGVAAPWQRVDGPRAFGEGGRLDEAARILDASWAIPAELIIGRFRYTQQHQLCDARPVYLRDTAQPSPHRPEEDAQHGGQASGGARTERTDRAAERQRDGDGDGNGNGPVYLFFRAHEAEWWLGPTVGGTECIARALGSRLRVVPVPADLIWRPPVQLLPPRELPGRHRALSGVDELGDMFVTGDGWHLSVGDARQSGWNSQSWCGIALALLLLACSARFGWLGSMVPSVFQEVCDLAVACIRGAPPEDKLCVGTGCSGTRKASVLACVVCLEAPREILLMPCRHVCCCRACADRLERCPMCRTRKTAFTKVFL